MTLTEYSKKHNLCRKTAWNHFKRGQIKGAYQLPSGKIIVPNEPDKIETLINLLEEIIKLNKVKNDS